MSASSPTGSRSGSRRDQLLETATDLFYRNGCHTTGIDKVLAEAGVAKMTLYKHFGSKDNLVLAACERFHEKVREEFEEAINEEGLSARERLEAIFCFMDEWSHREEFWGCPSINLAVQYPEHEHPIHQAAAGHKQFRIDYVADLAEKASLENPQEVARELVLLIEGVTVMVQVTGDRTLVEDARRSARTIISRAAGELS